LLNTQQSNKNLTSAARSWRWGSTYCFIGRTVLNFEFIQALKGLSSWSDAGRGTFYDRDFQVKICHAVMK